MLPVLLLAGIFGISAMLPDIQELQFSTKIKQNDHCVICYGSNCLNIGETRCEYYRQTEILLDGIENVEAEDTETRNRIDGYLMDYMHQDSWTNTDCIPLVSQYTDCNRENVCTGCQICNCDSMGMWNCTITQHCEPNAFIDVNHKALVVVTKKLKSYINILQRKKRKRSAMYDDAKEKDGMNPEDILKLLYGTENYDHDHKRKTTENIITQNNISKRVNDIDSNIWDTESLRFEELLNSIANDKNNNLNLANDIYVENAIFQNKSDLVNLTITTRGNSNNGSNHIQKNDIVYVKSGEIPTFDFLNNFDENDTRNLQKREIGTETNQTLNNTSDISYNSSNIRELRHNILSPLYNIVNEKQKELEQLINIKDKLVIYFKSFTDINVTSNATNSFDSNNNPHLYFYQLEIPAESNNETRTTQSSLENYFRKLKIDLFEVIRDIMNIQRLSNSSTMLHDLKDLIQEIRYYGNKDKQSKESIKPTLPYSFHLRKRFYIDSNSKQTYPTTVTAKKIIDIFEILKKNVSLTKALEPVSKKAKKIIKRITKQLLRDDFVDSSSKVFNSQYDIINLLNGIGSGWKKIMENIIESSTSDRINCMKLLHLEISADMKKVQLALKLLQVAENRRILITDESLGEKIVSKIRNDFKAINHLVKQMQLKELNGHVNINKSVMLKDNSKSLSTSLRKKNRKRISFFQTIKRLLKKSKNDIRHLYQEKVPKLDIIKHIEKNKMDDRTKNKLSEYEEIMQRWQNNLNVRNKRSPGAVENFFNRLKNIIPAYLRGKVVHKKKGNKTNGVKSSRKGHKNNKRIKLSSTTPKMYMHR